MSTPTMLTHFATIMGVADVLEPLWAAVEAAPLEDRDFLIDGFNASCQRHAQVLADALGVDVTVMIARCRPQHANAAWFSHGAGSPVENLRQCARYLSIDPAEWRTSVQSNKES